MMATESKICVSVYYMCVKYVFNYMCNYYVIINAFSI